MHTISSKPNLWVWDPTKKKLLDFGFCEALSILSIDDFLKRLHSEDRKKISSQLMNSLENYADFDAEFRMEFSKGNYEWVRAYGHYLHDDSNKPLTMIGSWSLVSEEKKNHALIELQQQLLALLLTNSGLEKPYPNPSINRDRLLTEDELQALKMIWREKS